MHQQNQNEIIPTYFDHSKQLLLISWAGNNVPDAKSISSCAVSVSRAPLKTPETGNEPASMRTG